MPGLFAGRKMNVSDTLGMFTEAGGNAVREQISKVLERRKTDGTLPHHDDEEEIMEVIYEVQDLVCQIGVGQVHPYKYALDDDKDNTVEGFGEVCDTAVRERIYREVLQFIANNG